MNVVHSIGAVGYKQHNRCMCIIVAHVTECLCLVNLQHIYSVHTSCCRPIALTHRLDLGSAALFLFRALAPVDYTVLMRDVPTDSFHGLFA